MSRAYIAKKAKTSPFGLRDFLIMPFGLKRQLFGVSWMVLWKTLDLLLLTLTTFWLPVILLKSTYNISNKFQSSCYPMLSINRSVCVFGSNELDFLRHRITSKGSISQPDRLTRLQNCKVPTDRAGLQKFLGSDKLLLTIHSTSLVVWRQYVVKLLKKVKQSSDLKNAKSCSTNPNNHRKMPLICITRMSELMSQTSPSESSLNTYRINRGYQSPSFLE